MHSEEYLVALANRRRGLVVPDLGASWYLGHRVTACLACVADLVVASVAEFAGHDFEWEPEQLAADGTWRWRIGASSDPKNGIVVAAGVAAVVDVAVGNCCQASSDSLVAAAVVDHPSAESSLPLRSQNLGYLERWWAFSACEARSRRWIASRAASSAAEAACVREGWSCAGAGGEKCRARYQVRMSIAEGWWCCCCLDHSHGIGRRPLFGVGGKKTLMLPTSVDYHATPQRFCHVTGRAKLKALQRQLKIRRSSHTVFLRVCSRGEREMQRPG